MKYVWHEGAWRKAVPQPPRPPVFPGIIRDHMDPVQHPVTGEVLDSKSAFRERTKDAGCVELGNDAQVAPKQFDIDRKELRADIATAMEQVEQGYRPEPAASVSHETYGPVRTYGT